MMMMRILILFTLLSFTTWSNTPDGDFKEVQEPFEFELMCNSTQCIFLCPLPPKDQCTLDAVIFYYIVALVVTAITTAAIYVFHYTWQRAKKHQEELVMRIEIPENNFELELEVSSRELTEIINSEACFEASSCDECEITEMKAQHLGSVVDAEKGEALNDLMEVENEALSEEQEEEKEALSEEQEEEVLSEEQEEEALSEEQEEEALSEEQEDEKEALSEEHEDEKEALSEEQEDEKEALSEEQEEKREALSEEQVEEREAFGEVQEEEMEALSKEQESLELMIQESQNENEEEMKTQIAYLEMLKEKVAKLQSEELDLEQLMTEMEKNEAVEAAKATELEATVKKQEVLLEDNETFLAILSQEMQQLSEECAKLEQARAEDEIVETMSVSRSVFVPSAKEVQHIFAREKTEMMSGSMYLPCIHEEDESELFEVEDEVVETFGETTTQAKNLDFEAEEVGIAHVLVIEDNSRNMDDDGNGSNIQADENSTNPDCTEVQHIFAREKTEMMSGSMYLPCIHEEDESELSEVEDEVVETFGETTTQAKNLDFEAEEVGIAHVLVIEDNSRNMDDDGNGSNIQADEDSTNPDCTEEANNLVAMIIDYALMFEESKEDDGNGSNIQADEDSTNSDCTEEANDLVAMIIDYALMFEENKKDGGNGSNIQADEDSTKCDCEEVNNIDTEKRSVAMNQDAAITNGIKTDEDFTKSDCTEEASNIDAIVEMIIDYALMIEENKEDKEDDGNGGSIQVDDDFIKCDGSEEAKNVDTENGGTCIIVDHDAGITSDIKTVVEVFTKSDCTEEANNVDAILEEEVVIDYYVLTKENSRKEDDVGYGSNIQTDDYSTKSDCEVDKNVGTENGVMCTDAAITSDIKTDEGFTKCDCEEANNVDTEKGDISIDKDASTTNDIQDFTKSEEASNIDTEMIIDYALMIEENKGDDGNGGNIPVDDEFTNSHNNEEANKVDAIIEEEVVIDTVNNYVLIKENSRNMDNDDNDSNIQADEDSTKSDCTTEEARHVDAEKEGIAIDQDTDITKTDEEFSKSDCTEEANAIIKMIIDYALMIEENKEDDGNGGNIQVDGNSTMCECTEEATKIDGELEIVTNHALMMQNSRNGDDDGENSNIEADDFSTKHDHREEAQEIEEGMTIGHNNNHFFMFEESSRNEDGDDKSSGIQIDDDSSQCDCNEKVKNVDAENRGIVIGNNAAITKDIKTDKDFTKSDRELEEVDNVGAIIEEEVVIDRVSHYVLIEENSRKEDDAGITNEIQADEDFIKSDYEEASNMDAMIELINDYALMIEEYEEGVGNGGNIQFDGNSIMCEFTEEATNDDSSQYDRDEKVKNADAERRGITIDKDTDNITSDIKSDDDSTKSDKSDYTKDIDTDKEEEEGMAIDHVTNYNVFIDENGMSSKNEDDDDTLADDDSIKSDCSDETKSTCSDAEKEDEVAIDHFDNCIFMVKERGRNTLNKYDCTEEAKHFDPENGCVAIDQDSGIISDIKTEDSFAKCDYTKDIDTDKEGDKVITNYVFIDENGISSNHGNVCNIQTDDDSIKSVKDVDEEEEVADDQYFNNRVFIEENNDGKNCDIQADGDSTRYNYNEEQAKKFDAEKEEDLATDHRMIISVTEDSRNENDGSKSSNIQTEDGSDCTDEAKNMKQEKVATACDHILVVEESSRNRNGGGGNESSNIQADDYSIESDRTRAAKRIVYTAEKAKEDTAIVLDADTIIIDMEAYDESTKVADKEKDEPVIFSRFFGCASVKGSDHPEHIVQMEETYDDKIVNSKTIDERKNGARRRAVDNPKKVFPNVEKEMEWDDRFLNFTEKIGDAKNAPQLLQHSHDHVTINVNPRYEPYYDHNMNPDENSQLWNYSDIDGYLVPYIPPARANVPMQPSDIKTVNAGMLQSVKNKLGRMFSKNSPQPSST